MFCTKITNHIPNIKNRTTVPFRTGTVIGFGTIIHALNLLISLNEFLANGQIGTNVQSHVNQGFLIELELVFTILLPSSVQEVNSEKKSHAIHMYAVSLSKLLDLDIDSEPFFNRI